MPHTTSSAPFAATPGPARSISPSAALLCRVPWHKLGLIVGLGLFGVAALVLFRELEALSWAQLKTSLAALPPSAIAAAMLLSAVSYVAISGYDLLAARHLGLELKAHRIAITAFVAHAFSFVLGFGLLSGGAVRLRAYGAAGVPPADAAGIGVLSAILFWFGVLAGAALCLLLAPHMAAGLDGMPAAANAIAGLGVILALAGLITWASASQGMLRLGAFATRWPGWRLAAPAAIVWAVDMTAAAGALFLLLPHLAAGPAFLDFLPVFVLATAIGVVSHVPGGLGVFEAAIVLALPEDPTPGLLGALLAFRVIYYVLPFTAALLLMGLTEAVAARRVAGAIGAILSSVLRPLAPLVLAACVFFGGVVLLLSGALPAETDRLHELRHLLPLPFVETSHLLASVVGFVLLVVASGLYNRLATAWRLAMALLLAGALFSLLKGYDYEEAAICLAVAGLLLASRDAFYRHAGLLANWPSLDWLVAILVVVGASIWLGLFAYRHVDYSADLWWSFAYHGDAPRFLRASLAVAVAAIALGVYRLVHPAPRRLASDNEALGAAEPIVACATRTEAQLALIGDKSFLFDRTRTAFVMYGVEGRSYIAMGDPVAPSRERAVELVWAFAELADRNAASAAFYQASADLLPAYLDAGFALVKLGEEAWVDLSKFTLDGAAGRKLRQTKARCERQGLRVALVPAAEVPPILEEVRAVSDAWLADKRGEKGFSLGFWTDDYLRRSDLAVVRLEGRIVAFANIWRSAGRAEFSIDLMRHRPDSPPGTMDCLFIALMERAKAEGFAWFNLGMTPLAGQPRHRLAPPWARILDFAYRHGDRFYNFEGLRKFKEKFDPQWRPRYLAYRGKASLARVLIDATRLIAASANRARERRRESELPPS
jgi:phosphatidylglycerol lysyltransferase